MRRVTTLLIASLFSIAVLLAMMPRTLLAQEARPAYCARLNDDDCTLLQAALTTMADVRSGRSTGAFTLDVSNVPDLPLENIALTLTSQATYALDADAHAAGTALADLSAAEVEALLADPAALLARLATVIAGTRADSVIEMTVSPEVIDFIMAAAAEQGEPLPVQLPTSLRLSSRMVDGTAYVNLSDITAVVPGLRAVGDLWLGAELAPLFDFILQQGELELDLSEMTPDEQAQFSQIISAVNANIAGPLAPALAASPLGPQLEPYLLVERVEDDEVDGRAAATFVTSIDYAALLQDPTVQDLLLELMLDQGIVSITVTPDEIDAIFAVITGAGPPLLETLGLEFIERIDPQHAYLLETELDIDWDLAQFAPLLGADEAEAAMLPRLQLTQRVQYRDHNEAVSVEPPATALIVDTGEVLALVAEQMARQAARQFEEDLARLFDEPTDATPPAIVAGALVPLEPDAAAEPSAVNLYSEALDLVNAGEYAAAIELFDEAIALEPDNAVYYTERGRAYYFSGALKTALADYETALALEPSATAYNARGVVYDDQGDRAAAMADYEAAIALDPTFPYPFFNLALAHLAQGAPEEALANFDAALVADPNYVGAYQERGKLYDTMGEYTRAIEDFDAALALDPNFAPAYVDRGNAWWALEEYDAAAADYTTAIELVPGYAIAYNNRGRLRYFLGDAAAAVADFNEALASDPDYVLALYNRGEAYYSLGDYAAAIEDFNVVEELNPDYGDLFYARGLAHFELDNHAEALADFTRAIERNPDNAFAYLYRGDTHFALGNYEEEYADYTRAIELDPTFADAYYYRALNSWDQDREAEAIADISAAIGLEPENTIYLNERALFYIELEELELALADLSRIIEVAPDDAQAHINRSYIYSLWQEHELALADASRAVELTPDDPVAWGNRADANGQLGNIDQALADFTRALELDPEYATAYLDRGLLFERLERHAEAIEDFTAYLELAPFAENRAEIEAKVEALQ